eukprot:1193079-Prorocentrum_minimum.AAC.2
MDMIVEGLGWASIASTIVATVPMHCAMYGECSAGICAPPLSKGGEALHGYTAAASKLGA